MSATELEAPRALRRPGDVDAVSFSWADAGAQLYGHVRVATGLGAGGEASESALAVAFAGRETLGALVNAPGVTATVDEPLGRWSLRSAQNPVCALEFEALTPPAEAGARLAKAGGLEGYAQLCRVRGTVEGRPVRGLGQRDRAWGNPDWDDIALTRAVGAWRDDGSGIVLAAVRRAGASAHADETLWGAALDPRRVRGIENPRLSTTTDAARRQIRAGLELWIEDAEDHPFRGTGEVLAGAALDLGALRLDCAFFRWHLDGGAAVGRYDILRRT